MKNNGYFLEIEYIGKKYVYFLECEDVDSLNTRVMRSYVLNEVLKVDPRIKFCTFEKCTESEFILLNYDKAIKKLTDKIKGEEIT